MKVNNFERCVFRQMYFVLIGVDEVGAAEFARACGAMELPIGDWDRLMGRWRAWLVFGEV